MTIADIWSIMPIMILAAGALVVLLLGAVAPGRYGTAIGVVTLLGAAIWCVQLPPQIAVPTLGVALTPFARFFTVLFSLTAAIVLLLSHDYNERRSIRGEEYPATILFAVFGMAVLSASTNFLPLFLGLEGLTFAFYFLVAIDRERPESGEAGLKYLLMGAVVFLLILLPAAGTGEALRIPLWWLAFLSMVVGNLAALRQKNLKRMLAYSAIAQMGYVTLALLSGTGGGYGAAAFYVVAYTAMNLSAFGAVV